jgi:hypothetical protein
MKKIAVALLALTFIGIPRAEAATPVIRVVDKPHVNYDGTFRENDLATALLPDGRLGVLVYGKPSSRETFVIDAALVDEIQLFSKSSTPPNVVAENWLYRLKNTTRDNKVVVLPYGNPDEKLLKRIAPSELNFYRQYAEQQLEKILNRPIVAEIGWSKGRSAASPQLISDYNDNRRLLRGLSTLTTTPEINQLRARLGIFMNPLLNKREISYFAKSKDRSVKEVANKLKVISGRYQITSSGAKLPVTLVNEFETATVVSVSLIPMNSRIHIENVNNIELAPNSRQQILVPVDVVAPGSTLVRAQFLNSKGQQVGLVSELDLTATIIDSRVAWFTTAAAVLLLLGAITQSVRRFRKVRHEK